MVSGNYKPKKPTDSNKIYSIQKIKTQQHIVINRCLSSLISRSSISNQVFQFLFLWPSFYFNCVIVLIAFSLIFEQKTFDFSFYFPALVSRLLFLSFWSYFIAVLFCFDLFIFFFFNRKVKNLKSCWLQELKQKTTQ